MRCVVLVVVAACVPREIGGSTEPRVRRKGMGFFSNLLLVF